MNWLFNVLPLIVVLTEFVSAAPVYYAPRNGPWYAPQMRDRRQEAPLTYDPMMMQYQQLEQQNYQQLDNQQRQVNNVQSLLQTEQARHAWTRPYALGPEQPQKQEQLPYDQSNADIPQLSLRPLVTSSQLPSDVAGVKHDIPIPQPQAPRDEPALTKTTIPQSEEQREAMEMFNEKVDLGLFVNNDIQPNVVMMEGKRSETPVPAAEEITPEEITPEEITPEAITPEVVHEISKKSEISKATDSSLAATTATAAATKSDESAKLRDSDDKSDVKEKIVPIKVQGEEGEEGKRSVRETVTCQGEKEWLNCPTYHLIKIHSAFWGRDQSKACSRSQVLHGLSTDKTCAQDESNTMLKVQNSCDGENVCEVVASPLFFDRQDCPDTYKFLRLNWECAKSESRIKDNLDRDAPKLERKASIPNDMVSTKETTVKEKITETTSKPVETISKAEVPVEERVEESKPVKDGGSDAAESSSRRDSISSSDADVLHRDADYEKSISEVVVASSEDSGTGFSVEMDDDKTKDKKAKKIAEKNEQVMNKAVDGVVKLPKLVPTTVANDTGTNETVPIVQADGQTNSTAAVVDNTGDKIASGSGDVSPDDIPAPNDKAAEASPKVEPATKSLGESTENVKSDDDGRKSTEGGSGSLDLMEPGSGSAESSNKKSVVFVDEHK